MEIVTSSAAFPGDENKANITLSNQLASPLLRLPAELRNKIYTFVGSGVVLRVNYTDVFAIFGTRTLYFHVPGLLSTCKQIREEATSLLWTSTTLDITRSFENIPAWDHKQSDCTFVNVLRVPRQLAQAVEYSYTNGSLSKSRCSYAIDVQNLDAVYVQGEAFREESVSAAIRDWFGSECLDVEFGG